MKSKSINTLAIFAVIVVVVLVVFGFSVNRKTLNETNLGINSESIHQNIISDSFFSTKNKVNDKESAEHVSDKTIESKLAQELELNKLASLNHEIFSEKNLYEYLIKRGAKIDDDLADRMKNEAMTPSDRDFINALMGQLLSQEENFKIELKQYNNFNELKAAADKTSKSTGKFYGNDVLNELMAYKGSTLNDIKQLLDSGAVLPDEAVMYMVYSKNIDLAIAAKNAGYNLNVNYYDKFSGMNAIEAQANLFAINPSATSSEEKIAGIKKLVDLGVSLKVADGTRDALDLVLEGIPNQSLDNGEQLINLAKYMNKQGLYLEESHKQAFIEIKNKYPELYEKYYGDFQ